MRLYECNACPYCGGEVVDISTEVNIKSMSNEDPDELRRILANIRR